jgi:hypothetical protein
MPSPEGLERDEEEKDRLINSLVEVRREIVQLADSLPRSMQTEVFLGTWSASELLAHLAGWDHTNMDAAQEVMAGRVPSFFAHHDRNWASYNEALVARFRRNDFGRLVRDVERSHRELIRCLEAIPAAEIDRDRGLRSRGWKVTIGRLLRAERQDEIEHLEQLRAFASQGPGGRGG